MAPSCRQISERSPLVNQQRQITSFFGKYASFSSPSPSPSPPLSNKKTPKSINPNPNSPSPSPSPSRAAEALVGNGIPVSPEVANGLKNDEAYGVVLMRVVILGRLRWKAGAIKTGRYGFYARCDVWLRFNPSPNGQVPLLAPSTCKVDV
ncbi:hypothetical protein ARALYDRAFT_911793 [Arabidopsis lyrata subsp. lyrata]|uniref:Uncharacterized protein n=1 Tax=Arabidopsis lyrata subsp. lyrata TaxID=81972 RepID=D7M1Z7_ARALL|nr:hypothetical protein ARALYDRAFT_911793 [Arabidopsis lyrata subsp. lyrata]